MAMLIARNAEHATSRRHCGASAVLLVRASRARSMGIKEIRKKNRRYSRARKRRRRSRTGRIELEVGLYDGSAKGKSAWQNVRCLMVRAAGEL